MPEERYVTGWAFLAFVAFQVVATLEADTWANAGVEKLLSQRLPEKPAPPDEDPPGYAVNQQQGQHYQEANEHGRLQQ